jgi:5-methyltetrahydrofolate--homocysteine methyltransferase
MSILETIASQLERGEHDEVRTLTEKALSESLDAVTILDQGLIAGMQVVGEQFRKHEIFLPDVLMAAKAMNAGLKILEPHLSAAEIASHGKVVIGTVKGDLHDIGKNLVGIMLAGAGFEVIDLGKDVPPEMFVDTAAESGADVIGMSALLTTTMPGMKAVVDLVKARGLDGSVRTVIGGAPVTEEYANEIGADGYSFDAANAVECVKKLVEKA